MLILIVHLLISFWITLVLWFTVETAFPLAGDWLSEALGLDADDVE